MLFLCFHPLRLYACLLLTLISSVNDWMSPTLKVRTCQCSSQHPPLVNWTVLDKLSLCWCSAQWKVLWRTLGHGAVFTLVLSLSSSLFFPQVFLSPFPPPAPWPVSVALFAESGRVVLSVPFSLPGLLLLLLHPNVVAWVNTPPLPHLLLLFISFTYLPTNLHSFSPNYANAQSSYCSTKATSGSILKKAHNQAMWEMALCQCRAHSGILMRVFRTPDVSQKFRNSLKESVFVKQD